MKYKVKSALHDPDKQVDDGPQHGWEDANSSILSKPTMLEMHEAST
jgi:hypothetical protein